jgi:ABC-type transport system involved in cytochrome c biogenesis permease subunit
MRRPAWTLLGLAFATALATALAAPTLSASEKAPAVEKFGAGAAYKALAALPVQHQGRVKPLDTLAREELKAIYGRERITFRDDEGEVVATWEPVAAILDWQARPEFWNTQPILKVEYLPLKRVLLAEPVKELLDGIAAKPSTPQADREAMEKLTKRKEVDASELADLLRSKTLPKDDLLAIARMHTKLGAASHWLSPDDLSEAHPTVDGHHTTFVEWAESIQERIREARRTTGSDPVLTDLDQAAYDAASALGNYRQIRDNDFRGGIPVRVVPRPYNAATIRYAGGLVQEVRAGTKAEGDFSPIAVEVVADLMKVKDNTQAKDWALPGTDVKFDESYADWLAKSAAWVPLPVLTQSDEAELLQAGFPADPVRNFRSAWKAFLSAERASPGRVDEASAKAVVASARDLGTEVNAGYYPTPKEMAREVAFNAFGPFWWAPFSYGLGAVLLALSLSVGSYRSAVVSTIHRALYAGGLAAFVGGIVLEVYGFSQRVLITGWAPVTNMYETVIFVGAVSSILGLVLEAIYRRTYAALAGSMIATVCTALAATIPLLDPTIHSLPPVLRSNLWLTIHVLTIVSSYAAFALAMGLGLIATWYYWTATYRRSAGYLELLAPTAPGLPVLGLGLIVLLGSYKVISMPEWVVDYGFWPGILLTGFGWVLTLTGPFACLGEFLNRLMFPRSLVPADWEFAPSRGVDAQGTRELVGAGGPLPPLSGGSKEFDDPRTEAMRATAAKIKPLSNFIYRAMQVGVLLVAAGTILGGVWADYSWGRFWGWDAKEVWALVTLLVYLVPLHGRFAGWVHTFGLVMASVVCFLSVLMAWYGVNFVIGVGLHTYGFSKGGGQWSVGMVTLTVLSFAAAAAWRRARCQRVALG